MGKGKKLEPQALTQAGEPVKVDDSELDEAELVKVSGGGILSSAATTTIKAIGEALTPVVRKG